MTDSSILRRLAENRSSDGIERLDSPNWNASRFRWEYYVPRDVRAAWAELSADARLMAYVWACDVLSSDDADLS